MGGGGGCDGHAPGSSVGRVYWATVGLRRRSIYSLVAGKLCVEYSAARPHSQFDISVPRGKFDMMCYCALMKAYRRKE